MDIIINCVTGNKVPVSSLEIYPGRLKKHSILEIERVKQSIISDGLLFPITIGKVEGHNYIIDGECTYLALKQVNPDIEVPVVIVRCNAESIKKLLIISASTNHCVTESSLKSFVEGTGLNLKDYGFSTPDLIDFHTDEDLGLYVATKGGKFSEQKLNSNDFKGLLL